MALCYKGAGHYSKAIALFTEIARQSADERRAALMDADDCLLEQGKIAESIDFMTSICNDYPAVADAALLRRAQRRYDICKYAEALADFQKCLADYKYDSDQTAVIKTRIDELRLHTADLFDGASASIQAELTRARAANEEGSYIKLLKLRLGESLIREQKWTEAKSYLQTLLSEYPSDVVNIEMSLGLCGREMENYDEAIALYREIAAGNSPRKLDAIFCIRYAMIEQGKTDEAAAYFAGLDKTYPEVASQVILKRAVLRAEETGETKASIDDFKQFVADNPNDRQTPWAKLQIASQTLYFERNRTKSAQCCRTSSLTYPSYPGNDRSAKHSWPIVPEWRGILRKRANSTRRHSNIPKQALTSLSSSI